VEKYEITKEAYDKRSDSARKWMQQQKLGIYASSKDDKIISSPSGKSQEVTTMSHYPIHVNDRCLVSSEMSPGLVKKGTVRFLGPVHFSEGDWVGVAYDEPYGKHDGCVQNYRYFTCPDKHGVFVHPHRVHVLANDSDRLDTELLEEL
jgi:tubulin-folding cofactor B